MAKQEGTFLRPPTKRGTAIKQGAKNKPEMTMEEYLLSQLDTPGGAEGRHDDDEAGRLADDQAGGDCHEHPEPGDEPTEQREQSQTACRLSYAESRRRKADRPRATESCPIRQI